MTQAYESQHSVDQLELICDPLLQWYRANKRDLPWRNHISAYRVWLSEIMLQQTRVEAVKPYYARFLEELPDLYALATCEEDKLMKLWQGLGYYNRVRNMQKAAQVILQEHDGEFPKDYHQILSLPGIGTYTAGAISSIAFGITKPAVDGNVLRVLSRYLASYDDIMKQQVRSNFERRLEAIIPDNAASDFNQSLIELGALICIPNGQPLCDICPLSLLCRAYRMKIQMELPVKKKAKKRRVEEHTILRIRDQHVMVLHKRANRGLLAGLYELPNVLGFVTLEQLPEILNRYGICPKSIVPLPEAKHIFSHVEWNMIGYDIIVDNIGEHLKKPYIAAKHEEVITTYSIPTAFASYLP